MSLSEPGGIVKWSTNQRIDSALMESMGRMHEQSIWNGLAHHLFGGLEGFIGEGCVGSKGGGPLDWVIEAGFGVVSKASADAFEPDFVPVYVPTQQTGTLAAHDATNPRLDIITIKPLDVDDTLQNVKILSGGALVLQNLDTRTIRFFELTVHTGTPAGSPAPPATPIGEILAATFNVPATSGNITSLGIRDESGVASESLAHRPWRALPTAISAKTSNKITLTVAVHDLQGNVIPTSSLDGGRKYIEAILTDETGAQVGGSFRISLVGGGGVNDSNLPNARVLLRCGDAGTFTIQVEDVTTAYVNDLYLQLTPVYFWDGLTETDGAGYPSVVKIDFS